MKAKVDAVIAYLNEDDVKQRKLGAAKARKIPFAEIKEAVGVDLTDMGEETASGASILALCRSTEDIAASLPEEWIQLKKNVSLHVGDIVHPLYRFSNVASCHAGFPSEAYFRNVTHRTECDEEQELELNKQ